VRSGSRLARVAAGTGLWQLTALYGASAAVCCLLASRANADFVDLHVYRTGAEAVLHGGSLYGVQYRGLPFTYPPFAAVAFSAVAILPWRVAAGLVELMSAACVPAMLYFALRLRPVSGWLRRADAARLALAAGALALWLEPVRSTLGFGQVNLVLAVLILADLALPDCSPVKGIGIGIAAGIKLTPLIFAVYLLVTRRYRAAGLAAAGFAVTVAAGYVLAPGASAHYFWDGNFLRTGNISPVYNDWNQSVLGAVSRDIGRVPGPWWFLVLLAVAVAGLALAARSGRRGDDATGFGLTAITGLLVSPISWTHHWVIAVPALTLAGVVAWRSRAEWPVRSRIWLAAVALLAVAGWSGIARREPKVPAAGWLHLSPLWLADSQLYVVASAIALLIAAWQVLRHRLGRDWHDRLQAGLQPEDERTSARRAADGPDSQPELGRQPSRRH
jgi:alpha-1,2-mannosyltransferase